MIQGNIYHLMIGCPGDMTDEANLVIELINKWNVVNSNARGIALIPIYCKTASYPSMDKEAQKELNRQLCERSDALLCFFGGRLGSPTSTHMSGTVEEISEHLNAGKKVMTFFKKKVISPDPVQYSKLLDYKNSLTDSYGEFDDIADLKDRFTDILNLFVNDNFIPANIEVKKKDNLYSLEEASIIKLWCESGDTNLSYIGFQNGSRLYMLGHHKIETQSAREKVELEDLINRLSQDGYITLDNYDSKGHPIYKLTLAAFERFDS